LANKFFSSSGLPGSFVPEVWIANWTKFLDSNIGVIIYYQDFETDQILGAIGGLIHPDVNDGLLVAQELFWFVVKGAGTKTALNLYESFEDWAKMHKAKRLNMACVCNRSMKSVRKFYERKGFRPVDVSYFIDL